MTTPHSQARSSSQSQGATSPPRPGGEDEDEGEEEKDSEDEEEDKDELASGDEDSEDVDQFKDQQSDGKDNRRSKIARDCSGHLAQSIYVNKIIVCKNDEQRRANLDKALKRWNKRSDG